MKRFERAVFSPGQLLTAELMNDFIWTSQPERKRMKYYIAGPMTKYRDQNYNFPAFYKAQGLLELLGHSVVNPARMDLDDGHVQFSPFEKRLVQAPGFSMADAMRRDIAAIIKCDGVVVIDGWEESVGAKNEVHVARDILELPVYRLAIDERGWPSLEALV